MIGRIRSLPLLLCLLYLLSCICCCFVFVIFQCPFVSQLSHAGQELISFWILSKLKQQQKSKKVKTAKKTAQRAQMHQFNVRLASIAIIFYLSIWSFAIHLFLSDGNANQSSIFIAHDDCLFFINFFFAINIRKSNNGKCTEFKN